MDGHIDWLSFTLRHQEEIFTHSNLYDVARAKLREIGQQHDKAIFVGQPFDPVPSRAPYPFSLGRQDGHARIFGGTSQGTILYELSGLGCEQFRGHTDGQAIVAPIFDRVSRIDYAVDVRTDTRPGEFANKRSHDHFRSISFIRSDTGETAYSGSPKSDRFCRVYRYNPPHPRSNLLRVEFVFRRKLAKAAAQHYVECENAARFIADLGATWGWKHRIWQPEVVSDEKIRMPILSRSEQDTLMWLYKQVAPAMRRMLMSGALDLSEFLAYVGFDPENGD